MWKCVAPYLVLMWTIITESDAGEYCRNYSYCYYSCCGSYPYEYCCRGGLSGGSIAGSVIGALITAGIIIAIIVCICRRRNRQPGQIVMTTPTNNTTVISTTNSPQMFPGGVQPYAPPQYPYDQDGYQPSQAPGIMPYGGQPPYGGPPNYGEQLPYGGQPFYGGQPPYGGQPSNAPPPYGK